MIPGCETEVARDRGRDLVESFDESAVVARALSVAIGKFLRIAAAGRANTAGD